MNNTMKVKCNKYKILTNYMEKVIKCAKAYKTNGSNYVIDSFDEIHEYYKVGLSISQAGYLIAYTSQELEGKLQLIGPQTYDDFEEARKAAIILTMRLNKRDNNKWKCVSMTENGSWVADNVDISEMKSNGFDFYSNTSKDGQDFNLHIKCTDPEKDWRKSLTPIN